MKSMRMRLPTLLFVFVALTATARAQFWFPIPVPPDQHFANKQDASDYINDIYFQYEMFGLDSYVHSRTTELKKWRIAYNGQFVSPQYQSTDFQVEYFARDGVSSFTLPLSGSQTPLHFNALTSQPTTTFFVTDQSYNAVRAINPANASILATAQLPENGSPLGIAITPDGKFLWVCEDFFPPSQNGGVIEIIDTSSLQIVGSIPLGSLVDATWIAMTPDGKTAYVTNAGQNLGISGAVNSILIIDVPNRRVTGQILPPVLNPQRPEFGSARFDHLAVSPDGTLLYAVSAQGIFVFDTLTGTQINPPPSALAIVNIPTFNVAAPANDTQIVFHPNGSRAYFTARCPSPNGGNIC